MPVDYALRNLNNEIKKCHQCRLAETRKNALCGEGNLCTDLMLIAQAPGEHEDREGQDLALLRYYATIFQHRPHVRPFS